MSKIHIKKAQFANKTLHLLHGKTVGKFKRWNYDKEQTEEIERGLLRSVYDKLSEKDKATILDTIFSELKDMHNSVLSDRFERRRIRKRDADRIAKGYKFKKRTSLEQYKALKNGEQIPAHAVS